MTAILGAVTFCPEMAGRIRIPRTGRARLREGFSSRVLQRLGIPACLLVGALALSACGPFGYIGKVSQGSVKALEKAQAAQAETYAPYEYWAAKAYLERARVMMTYSEYERAFDYSSRAEQLAEAAQRKAERVKAQEAAKPQAPAAKPVQGEP